MLGTLRRGVAAIVFSLVNLLPFGWRALYVVGVMPLLLRWFHRSLGETRRFEVHREAHRGDSGLSAALRPFRNLVRMYPGRMIALCAALVPIAFILETAMLGETVGLARSVPVPGKLTYSQRVRRPCSGSFPVEDFKGTFQACERKSGSNESIR